MSLKQKLNELFAPPPASQTFTPLFPGHQQIRHIWQHFFGVAWQVERQHSPLKWALIKPQMEALGVRSVLDIGCNAGEVTRLAGASGIFAVGIDRGVDFRGIKDPLENACIGHILLTETMVQKLPQFDAGILLSVHHQWVESNGNAWTQNMFRQLAQKFSKAFFIEFAAINRKYGHTITQFVDNDEQSVTEYAQRWLGETLSGHNAQYLGKTPESDVEPHRFVFVCVPKA